jgi:hypothetical protein
VKQAKPSPRSFVTVGLVASPLEQQRHNSAGISPRNWLSWLRFCACPHLSKGMLVILPWLRTSPQSFRVICIAVPHQHLFCPSRILSICSFACVFTFASRVIWFYVFAVFNLYTHPK